MPVRVVYVISFMHHLVLLNLIKIIFEIENYEITIKCQHPIVASTNSQFYPPPPPSNYANSIQSLALPQTLPGWKSTSMSPFGPGAYISVFYIHLHSHVILDLHAIYLI